jgi:hypothetical protein
MLLPARRSLRRTSGSAAFLGESSHITYEFRDDINISLKLWPYMIMLSPILTILHHRISPARRAVEIHLFVDIFSFNAIVENPL